MKTLHRSLDKGKVYLGPVTPPPPPSAYQDIFCVINAYMSKTLNIILIRQSPGFLPLLVPMKVFHGSYKGF